MGNLHEAVRNAFNADAQIYDRSRRQMVPCFDELYGAAAGLIPFQQNRAFEVLTQRCGSRQEGWVFPSKRSKSGHLTTMANWFRDAREKAGLPEGLVLYCGRHDYGTRILKKTGNLAAVMRTMGHKDVKTAMQYQRPELEIVCAALDHDTAVDNRA